jgi:arylsulfatase A
MRKIWVCFGLLLSTLVQGQNRPNIVFIIADDLGQEDLGCYGNPFIETPNIDKLAKNGILFTDAYSASPVCSPSRSAIMTGKHPMQSKLTNYLGGERKEADSPLLPADWMRGLPGSEITLGEKLKEAGYNTAMIGKWHLGGGKGESPWEQGFDFCRVIGKNSLDYYNYSIHEGSYEKEFLDKGKEYLTDKLTDYSVEYLKSQNGTNPFFLYVAYSAPHVLIVPRGDKVAKYLFKNEKFGQKYNPYYAAMIESLDDGVGRIYQELENKGQLNNTVFVFTSDNGFVGLPELGYTPNSVSQYRKWKGHVYEGGVRIPLLISYPEKTKQSSKCTQAVQNLDFFNTFLKIAGASPKPETQLSHDFSILLENPEKSWNRPPIFWHYPHFSNQGGKPAAGVRKDQWKLVKSYETDKVQLFDLSKDIAEKEDLSSKNPAKCRELHDYLLSISKDLKANMPIRKK